MNKKDPTWLIGASGFSYQDWKGIFYPSGLPAAKWLKYYAEHFNTVESNASFYRTPQLKTLQKWFADTPDNFVFSVKAPRTVPHFKKMAGTDELIAAFYGLMRNGLAHKIGTILFQFPPWFTYTEERLISLLGQLDGSFTK